MGEMESVRDRLNMIIEEGEFNLANPKILELSKALDEIIMKECYSNLYKSIG